MTQPDTKQPTVEELGAALSAKHRDFADIYLVNGLNAGAAARACSYKNPAEGRRLMARLDISAYVKARLEEAGVTAAEISARLRYFAEADMADFLRVAPSERSYWIRASESEEVREFAKRRGVLPADLDNYDISGLVGDENIAQTEAGVLMVCVKRLDAEVTVDWRAAERIYALGRIKKIKLGKDGSAEFELHDPVRALELLGKAQKMFTDRHEHSGPDGSPIKFITGLAEDDL